MASFVNPSGNYTASTTVTVTCDNGNDKVKWICNGYTGKWEAEPIDCSTQSSADKIFITVVDEGKIFVGNNSGFDFHGEDIREIPLSGVNAPTGIDYDHRTDKIYWSDQEAGTINRASLDGSNQEILIEGIGYPQGIVLDLMTNKMFWTDIMLERIVSASLLGSNRRTIISTDLYIPKGITLSQRRGKLYWTDEGMSTAKIEMSNKDGSDRRQLITTRLKQPISLALDSQEQRLYWTESYYDVIESIDLDDLTDRREHVYAKSGDLVVFGISLYFTSIYFTDLASRRLYESDIVEEIRYFYRFTAGAPTHVKIYTDLTCTDSCPGSSRCQLVGYNTSECTCIYGWTDLNCLSRITCTLPNPPTMASFVNPGDSYTASTNVTVRCDNGNDEAEWICNGYTGNWDKEPIDCSTQSSDRPMEVSDSPIALYAGLGGGAVFFVLLVFACVYWRKRKPQRSSVATPVEPAAPPPIVVYTAGAQPGVVTIPHGTSSVNQTVAMLGNGDKKQPEHECASTLNMTNGPSGAAAYPGQQPGAEESEES
eukprot:XP_011664004.1 PREDICTED: low-density lipoprotein receptor-related protein 1B-like [Strongylocentrotus purpuratus]